MNVLQVFACCRRRHAVSMEKWSNLYNPSSMLVISCHFLSFVAVLSHCCASQKRLWFSSWVSCHQSKPLLFLCTDVVDEHQEHACRQCASFLFLLLGSGTNDMDCDVQDPVESLQQDETDLGVGHAGSDVDMMNVYQQVCVFVCLHKCTLVSHFGRTCWGFTASIRRSLLGSSDLRC